MTCAGCLKRAKSPISAHSPAAVSVSMPRRHQPARGLRPRRRGQRPRDLALELLAADHQRQHGAAIVLQRPLRRRLRELDAGQPPEMGLGPVGLRPLEADLAAQQQLRQPMPGAHQIAAQILTRTDEVAQRLLLDARDRHPMQLPGRQQPHQALGIATVGLDAVTGPARDQPRRADHAIDPGRRQAPRQHEPGRARLIGRADRPRQRGRKRSHILTATRQPLHPQLPRIAIQRRRDHTADVHIKRRPRLSLHHVGTPMIAVGAQATPGPSTRASHARVPTLTSPPDAGPTGHTV